MLRSFIRFGAGQSGSITFRISVLEDTSVTTDNFIYEPYTEEINTLDLKTTELCKITNTNGNVVAQDRPVFRNDKWQWEKNVKKIVFNGTENWADIYNEYAYTKLFALSTLKVHSNNFKEICSHFQTGKSFFSIDEEGLYLTTDGARIRFRMDIASNVTDFKAWLQANPITVYYISATPEYEDCTAEQSAVLDKLYNNFKLQKGTNNIIVESQNGVGAELELEYMQDNNLLREQEHKDFNNRITALENLLSTTQTSALLLDNLQNDLESEVN